MAMSIKIPIKREAFEIYFNHSTIDINAYLTWQEHKVKIYLNNTPSISHLVIIASSISLTITAYNVWMVPYL